MILIRIDAHSKRVEAICTHGSTSAVVIEELQTFAQFGLPETIVTDNGTCFVSAEFETFLTTESKILHLHCITRHLMVSPNMLFSK